jgi:radical SAM superfamily enzyme YgiQ (UPF0313 family)
MEGVEKGEMGKITFIYLPAPYLVKPNMYAPLGIMILAAVLEAKGETVGIENYSLHSIGEAMNCLPESEIYGLTATSLEVPLANSFAKRIKRKYPKSTVILGGPGTITPEYVDKSAIDSVCIGDGEVTIQEMIHDYKNGEMKRIYYGEPLEDLDSVPFPARHLVKDKLGTNIFAEGGGEKSTVVLTSRGCPFNCCFCSTTHGKVRYRKPELVAKEIESVKKQFGITQFRFSDDMITADRARLFRLCELLGPMDITWRVSCRVKPLDREMLKAMHEAGCRELNFGVESFDNDVLTALNKRVTARENAKALVLSKEAGITTRVLTMIRTPGQTERTVSKNIWWLEWVPFDVITCTTLLPLPGSAIWKFPDWYGIEILNRNLEDYNFYFWSPEGEREWTDIIKLKHRSLEDFNREAEEFREYLKGTGKLNTGGY